MNLIVPLLVSVAVVAPPMPASHKASDVELIANWVYGKDPTKAFADPFADSEYLTDRKDPLLYTDVPGVELPKGMKAVNYEHVQARIRQIKNGHKASPAVVIVRSSLEEPAEDGELREVRKDEGKPGGRVYYVEVAIGNSARHWMKIVVREEGDKPKAEIIRNKVS